MSAYWLETRYAWIDYRRDLPWLFLRFKELSLRLLPDAKLLSDRMWVGIPSCRIRKVSSGFIVDCHGKTEVKGD